MGIFFLNAYLPGMWQFVCIGNRRILLTITPRTNSSSYYCTGCEPVAYYTYATDEPTNSEVRRLAQVTPLGSNSGLMGF